MNAWYGHVTTWYRQATSHCPDPFWPRSMSHFYQIIMRKFYDKTTYCYDFNGKLHNTITLILYILLVAKFCDCAYDCPHIRYIYPFISTLVRHNMSWLWWLNVGQRPRLLHCCLKHNLQDTMLCVVTFKWDLATLYQLTKRYSRYIWLFLHSYFRIPTASH